MPYSVIVRAHKHLFLGSRVGCFRPVQVQAFAGVLLREVFGQDRKKSSPKQEVDTLGASPPCIWWDDLNAGLDRGPGCGSTPASVAAPSISGTHLLWPETLHALLLP